MKVLVAVKRVVDANFRIRVKADGSGVDLGSVKSVRVTAGSTQTSLAFLLNVGLFSTLWPKSVACSQPMLTTRMAVESPTMIRAEIARPMRMASATAIHTRS